MIMADLVNGQTMHHHTWLTWQVGETGELYLRDRSGTMVGVVACGQWLSVYDSDTQPLVIDPREIGRAT